MDNNQKTTLTGSQIASMIICTILLLVYLTLITWVL